MLFRDTGWEASIHRTPGSVIWGIWVYHKGEDGSITVVEPGGNFREIEKPVKQDFLTFKPLLEVNEIDAMGIFHALAKGLHSIDVKVESESTVKGKYEAQSSHLEDLREIIGLGKRGDKE